jgi:hypothetical protein
MNHLCKLGFVALTAAAVVAAACGGGGGKKTGTPTTGATAGAPTAQRSAPAGATAPAAAASAASNTAAPSSTKAAAAPTQAAAASPAANSGRTYSAAEAKTIVDATVLLPPDLPSGWKIQTDTTADNAAAAAADPKGAASFEHCGRLLGRTAVNQPFDVVQSFLAGETLSFFSAVTVYATEAGAIDCATEAAQRLAQPGELARALGSLFINPDAVVVTPVDYRQTAGGSFAATLTGQINANGTTVDLTILLVAFRKGNVTAVVGSARSGQSPPTAELTPYVDKTVQRITTYTSR